MGRIELDSMRIIKPIGKLVNKTCNSCGSDVPHYVTRCKHCFNDFRDQNRKKKTNLILPLLVFSLGFMGFVTTQKMAKTQISKQSIVEQESESLIMIEMGIEGPISNRVPFSDITSLEYVLGGDSQIYELFIIDSKGEKKLIFGSGDSIKKRADQMAEMMNKKLIVTNNTRMQR